MSSILVVEDDEKLNKVMWKYLSDQGYTVVSCLDADTAMETLTEQKIDIIVSDIMMKGIDGFEFADSVRRLNKTIPILFVSALDDTKRKGYRMGIDDYMVKPIELEELLMRVEALIRRANIANEKELRVGDLVLNAEEVTAFLNEEPVKVTLREFQILYKLLSYPKKTFTRLQLMDEFWGYETESEPRAVDVYITKLRNKFSESTAFEIVTVHGLGYKAVLKER
ncbi:response regulator transcription factor [Gracilibacillus caseinilyticus]|uniref:Heme response regulator HssR n=1 Tax=Gracilibacillus caseinilyticus TaxID=2932256 RepID=A0ABY4EX12_9BACI|nr:response regulator transcription factor [Gracilibacillus caseinilyticus]UOQ48810.1 response regulator transcription factor [Gracilibacillus caseinilyticus]